MKTRLTKTFLFLFAFVISVNAFGQLSVSLSTSNHNGYNVSCFGGTDGSITATPSGGTSPYTYAWSNSATTQTISSIAASYYVVTVTDAVHNTATAGVTLTEPTALNMTFTRSSYSNGYNVSCYQCYNGSITTTPSGGVTSYSFLWSDGPTTQNRSSIGGGTYIVTITDANGCTKVSAGLTLVEPTRDDWTMAGNSGSNPSSQYIGTSDSTDFVFRTNTTARMRIKGNGYVGIGTSSPTQMLEVNGNVKVAALTATSIKIPAIGGNNCTILALDVNGNIINFDNSVCTGEYLPLWSTAGNTLPNNTSQFIGTRSNHDFRIKTNNTEQMIIKADGKVGIGSFGTSSPSSLLEVKGTGVTYSTSSLNVTDGAGTSLFFVRDDGKVGIGTSNPAQKLEIKHNDDHGGLVLNRENSTKMKSQIIFKQQGTDKWTLGIDRDENSGSLDKQNFFIYDAFANTTRFIIDKNGKVGIGVDPDPTSTSIYRLYVTGGIVTRDVKVTTANPMPDYVFAEKYSLMSLPELEQFIKANSHLPEIPSASDVQKNEGFEVGDMQTRLLKKVEELTLYIIQQQKQLDALKEEIALIKTK